ncbi:MAG: proton-conducting transporter membrane subunit [Vulcanococcus sp.]
MTLSWSSPDALLTSWLLVPYLAAFLAVLLPSLSHGLVLLCCSATSLVGAEALLTETARPLRLLGDYGVQLSLEPLAGWFVLLNGLVCLAVWLAARQQHWDRTGWMLLLVLLGSLNTSFLTTDLISLYVSLEVVGITAFLLILKGQSTNAGWIALRYLLVGNTAMAIYLIGAGLVYAQAGSFGFEALAELPLGAPLVLVLVGLLTKAGVFLNGLWLPRTHAEAPAEVSALLSGVVVGGGAVPLLRLEQLNSAISELLLPVALASAVLGLIYALGVGDAKRLLAWSTLGQMGLVLLSPAAGGLLAFTHGLAKSALFLTARQWPTRSLQAWRAQALPWPLLLTLGAGSLSIAGLAPLLGYTAKKQLESAMPPVVGALLTVLSVGSVAVYCRLCRAPLGQGSRATGLWSAWLLLLPLIVGGALQFNEINRGWLVSVVVVVLGVALDQLLEQLRQPAPHTLPSLDRLPDLVGGLGLVGAGLLLSIGWELG